MRLQWAGQRNRWVWAAAALFALGCERGGEAAKEGPSTATAVEPARPAPSASNKGGSEKAGSAHATPGKSLPARKAHAFPAAAQLGSVPDGVGLAVGSEVPAVQAANAKGEPVALKQLLTGKRSLVVFYRGGWCPYCNFQIKALADAHKELDKRALQVALVSVDRPEEAARTQGAYELPFVVLSDPDLALHRAFRVLEEVDAATFEKLKGYGIDLEKSSGRSHHTIAVPALFLVDESAKVRWAHANRDYRTRPSVDQMLAAADQAFRSQ